MADTITNTYEFVLPEPFGSDNTWGLKLNDNFIALDTILASQEARIGTLETNLTSANNIITQHASTLSGHTTNLSTLNTLSQAWAVNLFDQNGGYQKFPSGLIMQWGVYTVTQTGLPVPIPDASFPIPFPNACLNMQTTTYNTTISVDGDESVIYTRTQFAIARRNASGLIQNWFAIGY